MTQKKSISLVLGSGGARGLAHIGIIRFLEEQGYQIQSIAGASIGSLIGGAYAAGKLNELEDWMCTIDRMDIANLLDLSWGSGGLFKGDKIIKTLVALLEDLKIEDLNIPFTAVAADIIHEKEVWLNSGSLFDAIRASVSLPLFFTPVPQNDRLLVDGGVLNPVPIAPTLNDNTDLTVAVNLGGPLQEEAEEVITDEQTESTWDRLQNQFMAFFDLNKDDSKRIKQWGMYDIADKAFDTMQSAIARQKLAAYPPDIEIIIPRNACGTLEFDRSKEMIDLGYSKATDAFKTFKNQ